MTLVAPSVPAAVTNRRFKSGKPHNAAAHGCGGAPNAHFESQTRNLVIENLSIAIDPLAKRNSFANDQFSMTNSNQILPEHLMCSESGLFQRARRPHRKHLARRVRPPWFEQYPPSHPASRTVEAEKQISRGRRDRDAVGAVGGGDGIAARRPARRRGQIVVLLQGACRRVRPGDMTVLPEWVMLRFGNPGVCTTEMRLQKPPVSEKPPPLIAPPVSGWPMVPVTAYWPLLLGRRPRRFYTSQWSKFARRQAPGPANRSVQIIFS